MVVNGNHCSELVWLAMPENIKYTGAPSVTPIEAKRSGEIPPYQLRFPEVQLSRAGAVAGAEVGRATEVAGTAMGRLGQSIATLGTTMEGAGNEMWNRAVGIKQLEAETKVNAASVAWEQQQVKSDDEFRKKSGENASSQALEAKNKSDEEARLKVRNSFGSQYEQRMFDQQTTRVYLQSLRASGAHAAQEQRTAATNAVEAKLSTIKARGISATEQADRQAALDEGMATIANEARHLRGYSAAETVARQADWRSDFILGSAQRMSDNGHPADGLKYLEDNADLVNKINPLGYDKTHKGLENERNSSYARAIADKAAQPGAEENQGAARQQLHDEINRAAKAGNWSEDMTLRVTDEADKRFDAKINKMQDDARVDRTRAINNVTKGLYGHLPGQKGAATTPEELKAAVMANDKGDWDRLTEAQRQEYGELALRNVFKVLPTPENQAEFHHWHGLAYTDPQQLVEQETRDPGFFNRLNLPREQKEVLIDALFKAQAAGGKATEDARVALAWSHGVENGLIPTPVQRKTHPDYARIHSYLGGALKEWHELNPGKMPKSDDYNMIINRAFSKKGEDDETKPFFGFSERYKRATTVSSEFKKNYLDKHPGAGAPEIQRAAVQAYLRSKLQADTAKPSGPATPTRPPVKTVPASVTPGG